MKLTEKTKKYLVIVGGVAIGISLIVAIGTQFGQPSSKDSFSETEQTVTETVVTPSPVQKTEEETTETVVEMKEETEGEVMESETELVIQPELESEQETNHQVADSRPAQTDQSVQSIQPEPTKPEPPSEAALTDPTRKPDGTELEEPPVPVEHESVEKPAEPVPVPEEPQAGETSGNQIYVPGFGWVENHGGGSSGIVAEDMYENGNKIGIMD